MADTGAPADNELMEKAFAANGTRQVTRAAKAPKLKYLFIGLSLIAVLSLASTFIRIFQLRLRLDSNAVNLAQNLELKRRRHRTSSFSRQAMAGKGAQSGCEALSGFA